MKNAVIKLAAAAISATVILSGCASERSIKITEKKDPIRMDYKEKREIKYTCDTKDDVSWTTENSKVAKVSGEGVVTAVGKGITVITAYSDGKYDNISVVVEKDETDNNELPVFDKESDISSISVSVVGGGKDDISVKKGEKHQLKYFTEPSGSTDKVVWYSEDLKVAKVSKKGVCEAVGTGKTVVKAIAPNGVSGELVVRVK